MNSLSQQVSDLASKLEYVAKDVELVESELEDSYDYDEVEVMLTSIETFIKDFHKQNHHSYEYPASWERCWSICGSISEALIERKQDAG